VTQATIGQLELRGVKHPLLGVQVEVELRALVAVPLIDDANIALDSNRLCIVVVVDGIALNHQALAAQLSVTADDDLGVGLTLNRLT